MKKLFRANPMEESSENTNDKKVNDLFSEGENDEAIEETLAEASEGLFESEEGEQSIEKNANNKEKSEGDMKEKPEEKKTETEDSGETQIIETKEKTDTRSKEAENRMLILFVMIIIMIPIIIWCAGQSVRNINMSGKNIESQGAAKKSADTKSTKKENKEVGLSADNAVAEILKSVKFDTKLSKLDEAMANGMITSVEGTEISLYMGSGTFADELLLMTAKSDSDAEKNEEYAKNHLQELVSSFQNYLPKEAQKVEGAVCVRKGKNVIACVTSDTDSVEKILERME